MAKDILRAFWNCGDNEIIEFAIRRARLNSDEKKVCECLLDECMTQEETAEHLHNSVRWVQKKWDSAKRKLLSIPWVTVYGISLTK